MTDEAFYSDLGRYARYEVPRLWGFMPLTGQAELMPVDAQL